MGFTKKTWAGLGYNAQLESICQRGLRPSGGSSGLSTARSVGGTHGVCAAVRTVGCDHSSMDNGRDIQRTSWLNSDTEDRENVSFILVTPFILDDCNATCGLHHRLSERRCSAASCIFRASQIRPWLRSSRATIASGFSPGFASPADAKLRRGCSRGFREIATPSQIDNRPRLHPSGGATLIVPCTVPLQYVAASQLCREFRAFDLWFAPQAIGTPLLRSESPLSEQSLPGLAVEQRCNDSLGL